MTPGGRSERALRADPAALKLPPQNVEAEQTVLGAILLDNQALYKALELIGPDEFYRPAHRRIFEAMIELSEQNQVVDLVTLTDHLQHAGTLEGIGGSAYLTDLAQSVATASSVTHHAKLIHETGINRALIGVATEIVTRGYEGTKRVDELLDYAERSIFGIAESRLKKSFSPIKEVVNSTVEHINKLYEQQEKITGIPTGFADLDNVTAGLQPSDLIIVAGRPSTGKTSLALGMALNAALHKPKSYKVAIFSLEMSKEQLCMRLLSAAGSLDMHRIRTGQLHREDWSSLTRAASALTESKIYIDDTAGITALEMRAKIRRQRAETGLDLGVVDYLQLMSGGADSENRQQEISDISRSLKSVAKELNIPVVALSQLSRAVESRQDKRPLLADLRESGAIEQDADLVMMIYRKDMYAGQQGEVEEAADPEHVAEIIISKHRNGPTGVVKLTFLPEYAKFGNYIREQH
ncbi:MAG: replicative DNA helicase [Nitrospiraceae bacterium]|nr:MAG: replicative DNA helicase [Nitrospiraceae bacterium]